MNNYYHQYQESMNEEGVEFVPNAWSSELPADILGLITDKVRSLPLTEFIRFGSVCLGWRSFSIENYQHIRLPNQVPVLLIPIPPSLLSAADHYHHQKEILSLPPSSSLIEEEEEEEEEKEEEEKVEEEEGEEKEIEKREEEEIENENENEKEEEDDEEEEEEEEEEDDHNLKKTLKEWTNFYSPREIWDGQDANQRHKNRRAFYSLSEKMVYRDFQLPVPYYKNILGSSYGWLVAVEECYTDNGQLYLPVSLFNPFRTYNNEIQLPPMTQGNPGDLEEGETIEDSYFLIKAFLSANPSSLSDPTTQLVVLAVYGRHKSAFCRPGDQSWTRLDLEDDYRPIQDIICYQDQFFAVLQNGYVFAFVLDAAQLLPTPIVTLGFEPPPDVRVSHITYLISGGDLLQVWRYVSWLTAAESERPFPVGNNPLEVNGYITRKFLVFKLDTTGEWVEMKTLNDRMLFMGTSSSMSLLASDFPGWSRPNSIYYTDDYSEVFVTRPHKGPHDIGIFNLEDGSFERHYEASPAMLTPKILTPGLTPTIILLSVDWVPQKII